MPTVEDQEVIREVWSLLNSSPTLVLAMLALQVRKFAMALREDIDAAKGKIVAMELRQTRIMRKLNIEEED